MHIDRNELDTKEEPEAADDTTDELTPDAAIQRCLFDQLHFRYKIKNDPDSADVLAYTDRLIAALGLAMWELGEYRKLKEALAVLRAVMP